MPQIGIDNLTHEHLRRYACIEAVAGFDDETQREIVWESERLSRVLNWRRSTTQVRTLFVRAPAITKSILERLKARIAELEGRPAHPSAS